MAICGKKYCVVCCDYKYMLKHILEHFSKDDKTPVIVTDPPFNISYHYNGYADNMPEGEYLSMLGEFIVNTPTVLIHYPEMLHKLSAYTGIVPEKVVSWVYNSNTAKQHRDIAFYGIQPDFNKVKQPYKNPNDKRIKQRIAAGSTGARLYDWWNVNQVKNISKVKTGHPCQMPIEVMCNIIGLLPANVVVIDPFCGSGTTGVACKQLCIPFLGFEIVPEYVEIACRRLAETVEGVKNG